jgi:hypothetical protein
MISLFQKLILMFQKNKTLYKVMNLLFLNALFLNKESAFVVQEMLAFVTRRLNQTCR